jgi:glycine C-acetyltransferase
MLYDAVLAQTFSKDLYEEGIFAVGFFFPVVPKGQARIRTQVSAIHTRQQLEYALDIFRRVGKKHGVLKN